MQKCNESWSHLLSQLYKVRYSLTSFPYHILAISEFPWYFMQIIRGEKLIKISCRISFLNFSIGSGICLCKFSATVRENSENMSMHNLYGYHWPMFWWYRSTFINLYKLKNFPEKMKNPCCDHCKVRWALSAQILQANSLSNFHSSLLSSKWCSTKLMEPQVQTLNWVSRYVLKSVNLNIFY